VPHPQSTPAGGQVQGCLWGQGKRGSTGIIDQRIWRTTPFANMQGRLPTARAMDTSRIRATIQRHVVKALPGSGGSVNDLGGTGERRPSQCRQQGATGPSAPLLPISAGLPKVSAVPVRPSAP